METIATNLRKMIFAEIENANKYEAAEEKLWNKAFIVAKTDREEGERIYRLAQVENDKMFKARQKVRHLRHALGSLFEAMEVKYDSWHPETAEF